MELRTSRLRRDTQPRPSNSCAQCGETIFMPEWSEYLSPQRVRYLWECEACGYKFETIVAFPEQSR
jgi:ribosomal protein S27AE